MKTSRAHENGRDGLSTRPAGCLRIRTSIGPWNERTSARTRLGLVEKRPPCPPCPESMDTRPYHYLPVAPKCTAPPPNSTAALPTLCASYAIVARAPIARFRKSTTDEARRWRIFKVSGRGVSHCGRVRGCSGVLGVQKLGASGFVCAREGATNWLPPAASRALASVEIYPYPRGNCSKEHAVRVRGPSEYCPRRRARFLSSFAKRVQ